MRVSLCLALILAGCSSLVPTTAMRLGGLSPLTADPAEIAVRLVLPEGVDVLEGSARLIYQVGRPALGQIEAEVVTLARAGDVFAIAADDLGRLRALQARARDWKAQDPSGTKGALSVSLTPCTQGAGPVADATVDVFLRITAEGAFLPLLRNAPLNAVAPIDQIGAWVACDTVGRVDQI